MSTVLFPVFSKIQEDKVRFRGAFLKSFKMVSLFAIPFGLFVFILSPTFLGVVYGEKWLPAAGVARILAFAGMLRALQGTMGPVFLAEGKSKLNFVILAVQSILFFSLIIPMTMRFGLEGAGSVVLFVSFVSFGIATFRVKTILKLSLQDLVMAWKPALVGSALMLFVFGLLTAGSSLVWHLSTSFSAARFISITILAGITYFFAIFRLDQDVQLEVRRFV